jgi:hypothetical protein
MRAIGLSVVLVLAFTAPALVGAQTATLAYADHIPNATNGLEVRLSNEFEQRNPDVHSDMALIEDAGLNATVFTAMGSDYCEKVPNDPRCPRAP